MVETNFLALLENLGDFFLFWLLWFYYGFRRKIGWGKKP